MHNKGPLITGNPALPENFLSSGEHGRLEGFRILEKTYFLSLVYPATNIK